MHATNYPHIAFFVHATKVTCAVPNDVIVVLDFRLFEGLGIVVISAANVFTGNEQLAYLTLGHFQRLPIFVLVDFDGTTNDFDELVVETFGKVANIDTSIDQFRVLFRHGLLAEHFFTGYVGHWFGFRRAIHDDQFGIGSNLRNSSTTSRDTAAPPAATRRSSGRV